MLGHRLRRRQWRRDHLAAAWQSTAARFRRSGDSAHFSEIDPAVDIVRQTD